MPASLSPGKYNKQSVGHTSDSDSDYLTHHEHVPSEYAFSNTTKPDTLYNAKNRSWQGIHDAITIKKNRDLFETDIIVQGNISNVDSTRITIQVNKNCMTELLLLDNTNYSVCLIQVLM